MVQSEKKTRRRRTKKDKSRRAQPSRSMDGVEFARKEDHMGRVIED